MAFKMRYKNLQGVVDELRGAVKAHAKQADTVEKHIKEMEKDSPNKYASETQRKAIWASKNEKKSSMKKSNEPRKTTKGEGRNFRTVEEGAGMTSKGVSEYIRKNPGSNLQTAVTGDVKPGSKDAKRRKSFCARSKGWTGERGKAARKRWRC